MYRRILLILVFCIFCCIPVSASSELRREINNENPLFIYDISLNDEDENDDIHMQSFWSILPEDVKPYFAIQVKPDITNKNTLQNTKYIEKMLKKANEKQIPVILQIETTDTRNGIKQTYYDELFKKYSCLIGLSIEGLSASGSTITALDQNYINTIKKSIDTVSSNDAMLFWKEMAYESKHVFLQTSADKDLYNKIKQHNKNIVLIKDNKGVDKRFAGTSIVTGYWLSDSIDNWGINSNDSIWWEAGYGHLYSPLRGKTDYEKWKSRFTFPDSQFGSEWLVALSQGATVFSLDSPLHGYASKDGKQFTPAFTNVILPLIRQMVEYKLIPSQEEVQNKVKVAFKPEDDNPQQLIGDRLFKGLYGPEINNLFEWMPSTGRYYFIPTLPVLCEDDINNKFDYVFEEKYTNKFLSNNIYEKTKLFNNIYDKNGYGDSWFVDVNNNWYITNPNENKEKITSFNIPLKVNSCTSLEGYINPHTFIIARENKEELDIYLNNYKINSDKDVWKNYNLACEKPEDYTKYNYIPNPSDNELRESVIIINGATDGKPSFNIEGKDGFKYKSEWNEEQKQLKIFINHNGEINLSINATGLVVDSAEKNIAPYGIVSTSSNKSTLSKNIIDGDLETYWESSNEDKAGSWIQLDFLHEVTINKMIIDEFLDRVTNYKIQYENKKGWKDLLDGNKIGKSKVLVFNPIKTNKVRIVFTGTKTDTDGIGSQPAINEWNVITNNQNIYNNASGSNLAKGQKCFISSYEIDEKENTENLTDGKLDTYCNIERNNGEHWIELNLDETVEFNKIVIYEYYDRIDDYHIKYFNDDRWNYVKQNKSNGNTIIDFFIPIKTDKLRIYIDSCKLDSYKKGRTPIISDIQLFNE